MATYSETKVILLGNRQYIAFHEIRNNETSLGDASATTYNMALKYIPTYKGYEETYYNWDNDSYTVVSEWNVENGEQQDFRVALEELPQIQLPNVASFYIAFSDGIRLSGVYKFAGFEFSNNFLQDFITNALLGGEFNNDYNHGNCIFAIYTTDYSFYDKNMNSMQGNTEVNKSLMSLIHSNIKSESFLGE